MVKVWRDIITIPTYEVGKPEKNPMFLEKRVYQGSSGVVYPYPVIESIADEKVDVRIGRHVDVCWNQATSGRIVVQPIAASASVRRAYCASSS